MSTNASRLLISLAEIAVMYANIDNKSIIHAITAYTLQSQPLNFEYLYF